MMAANAKIPPKPGKETVYIDVDEDITSIIDKVEQAKEKIVALVLPKRATVLQSIVNMRLLKRSADNAGKNIVLITNEEALIPLAGAAGIHVARNLQSAPEVPSAPAVEDKPAKVAEIPVSDKPKPVEGPIDEEKLPGKIDYEKPIGELAAEHELEHPETIELEDEDIENIDPGAAEEKPPSLPKDKKLKVPNYDRFRLLVGLGIVALIVLIVLIVLAFKVLPKATITIKTSSSPISANFTLTTSGSAKNLDEKAGVIPAALKAADQNSTQTVPATGQQNTGNKASGSVSMSTSDCSGQAPSIPAGTGISSNGLTFITQDSTTLQPKLNSSNNCYYSSNGIDVVAQTGGAKYNLSSGTDFDVSGYPSVTATNSSAFSGGTDNIQTVVAQSDVDNAKSKITSSDTDKFTKQFEQQLANQGYYVLTSTLKLSDPALAPTPAVGQPASNVSVAIKITYSVLAVKKDDLQKAISDQLNQQIDKTKQRISDNNILGDATVTVQDQSSGAAATLNISESTTAVPILNEAKIKSQAVGQKAGDIEASIGGLPGVEGVDVKMSPFWVTKAPKASKITIVQQQVKSSTNGN